MERDDESGFIYIGARYYCPWLARWLAVDPLESKYAPESPYNYCHNNPVRFIDPSGLGSEDVENPRNVYINTEGTVLGYDENVKEGRVYLADSKNEDGTFNNSLDLGVTQNEFVGFASLVYNESGGAKDESFAIANSVVNFVDNGGSSTLKNIGHIVLGENYYSAAVNQTNLENYGKLKEKDKNSRNELGAVVNALGRKANPTDARFSDNTNGATHWDGIDLVFGVTKKGDLFSNSHRNYTWSDDSKTLLQKYFEDHGVSSRTITEKVKDKVGKTTEITKTITNETANPANWKYAATGYGNKATVILGKTIFQEVTNPGEGKKKTMLDFSKIKKF